MRPRDIGTRAETAVVRYLQANGWPSAERRSLRGKLDAGDITGTPGLCWEVKGGEAARSSSHGQITRWLVETEQERINASADVGVLVVQRLRQPVSRWLVAVNGSDVVVWDATVIGRGEPSYVSMTLATALDFLRGAGYGDPLAGTHEGAAL